LTLFAQKQQNFKKEQEEQYDEDDNEFLDSNDIDDYTDWKAGNWCWLLPANNTISRAGNRKGVVLVASRHRVFTRVVCACNE
jgi:hypothetical protein